MRPDKLTIHDLFQKERRYVVPLYQRPYVWNQEAQWAPLWEDIERQAEACHEAGDAPSKRSHFLGAVVLNVSKIVGSGVARSEVIDGQQRLTTLQIFIAALRDYAASIASAYERRLRKLTEHEEEKPGTEAFFKVWPTNADRGVFQKVLSSGSPAGLLKSIGVESRSDAPRMALAYLYFHDRVREFVEAAGPDQTSRDLRIFALLQALRTSLQVVVIELEDEDDPQVIFETLNARGQPLLPSDLIRNYIFLQAGADATCDADDLYERYWHGFDNQRIVAPKDGEDRFWHVEERQGRLTRPRIDLFLFHYLVMQTERDLNIGQLFREFRDWRSDHPTSIEALLADLKSYGSVFSGLVLLTGDGRDAVFARRLRALDNSTVYPLLMYLLGLPTDRLPVVSRNQILDDLESWLVRRLVCDLTTKNYNRFFVSLLGKVKRAPSDADLADVVRAELTRSADPTTAWPTDEEFLRDWLGKPVYARSRPDRSAMLLRAIELRTRSQRNEAVTLPDDLSVEHLLPQKGELTDYPYVADMPTAAGESDDRCRERLVHTIGNLTLLTGPLNASASNGPFPGKVAKIVEDSDLRLNAWLRRDPPICWSENDIVERGMRLFETAVDVWPRPAVEPENLADDEPERTKGVWQFSDPAARKVKRDTLLAALGVREGVVLVEEGGAKFRDQARAVAVVVAVSKRYDGRGRFPYWYAYTPDWHAYLAEAGQGFLLLVCLDRETGYAVPRDVLDPLLPNLNSTTRKLTGKLHWHVHLVERAGRMGLLLPKSEGVLDLEPFAIGSGSAGHAAAIGGRIGRNS